MPLDPDEVALIDLLLTYVPKNYYGTFNPTFELRDGKITAINADFGALKPRVTLADVRKVKEVKEPKPEHKPKMVAV